MELKIYDKQGNLKMTASPDSSSQWNHEVGVENVVTVNFTTWEFLVLEVGWYIWVEGQKFSIKSEYRPKHIHDKKYSYNLKFYGREHDTQDILFCRLNQSEDDLESVFAYDGTPMDFLQKVVDNMNRNSDGVVWKAGEAIAANRQTINFNGLYCWDALSEMARVFGTEWWMDGEYLNLSKCVCGESTILGYGEGLKNGLTQNENTNAIKWFTRLIPVGSSKNIDRNKYGYSNLQLPSRERYIDVNTQYGLKEYREEAAFSNIYPHRVGTVSNVREDIRTNEDTGEYAVYFVRDAAIPFNPNDYMLGGEVIHLTFNTGVLAGKEFEVNWNNTSKEFEIINQYPDEKTQLPGGNLIPSTGDTYVLSNISMPDEYIRAAEQEFKEAVDAYLAEYAKDVSIYSGNTDYIYIEQNRVPLQLGQRVILRSSQYFESGGRESRITRISRKLNNLNDASIDCSDAVTSSWKSGVDSSLNQLQFAVAQEVKHTIIEILKTGESKDPTDYNVLSALRSLNTFLRKDRDENMKYLLSLLGGAVIRKWAKFGDFVTDIQGGYIDEQGNMEMESGVFRKRLFVPEIAYNRITYFKGRSCVSPGGGCTVLSYVDNGDGSYTITPDLTDADGLSLFLDDILTTYFVFKNAEGKLQGFEEMKFRVTAADYTAKTFTVVPKPGYDWKPAEQMILAQTGNFTDKERQNYILIDSINGNCCISFYENANTWDAEPAQQPSWFGKKKGRTVAGIDCDNFSAVLQNILMTGLIFQIDEVTGDAVRVPIEKGAWKSGLYGYYNRVSHAGCLWLCVNPEGTDTEPSDTNPNWLKEVDKGASILSDGEWKAEKTPVAPNKIMTFAGGVFLSKRETSEPPVACWKLDDNTFAMIADGAYAIRGSWDEYGNKEDWDVLFDVGTVVNGKDGTSIVFVGSYSVAPANPQDGWAYYNSTDKCSYVYQEGSWQVMVKDGKDGKDYEWIYTRTKVEEQPAQPYSDASKDDYVPSGWTDDFLGINEEYRYEWGCKRTKINGEWGDFSKPALVYRWADKGADGKGINPVGDWNTDNLPMLAGDLVNFAGSSFVAKRDTYLPPIAIWMLSDGTYAKIDKNAYAIMGSFEEYGHQDDWQIVASNGVDSASYWIDTPISVIHFTSNGTPSPSAFLATCKKSIGEVVSECSDFFLAARRYNGSSWSSAVSATKAKAISVSATAGYTQFCIRAYKTSVDANAWNDNYIVEKGVSVAQDGGKGDTGPAGAFPYDCGPWKSGQSYVWNAHRRDRVIHPFAGIYYSFLIKNYGSTVSAAPTSASGDTNWEAMNKFTNIATDTLFADGANVAGFMFKNGVMRSQNETNGVANMILNGQTGYFHCNNADITGVVNATSGTFNSVKIQSGQIAGFSISGGILVNNSFSADIIIRNDASNPTKIAGIGTQQLPGSTGVSAMGVFQNNDAGGYTNYGIIVSAQNATTNIAMLMQGGCIAGLAEKVGGYSTGKTIDRLDNIAIANGNSITLPVMSYHDDGHKVLIINNTTSAVNVYCSGSNYILNGTSQAVSISIPALGKSEFRYIRDFSHQFQVGLKSGCWVKTI